jgi:outer membrane immunogenic protein
MKRGLLAALTFAGAAIAGSAHAQEWNGFYIGGGAGYSFKSDDSETVVFDTNRDGNFNDTVRTGAGADAFSPGFCSGAAQGTTPGAGCRTSDDNVNFSARAGYDWQFGNWVVGAVGEYTQVNIGDDVSAFSTTPASYTFTRDLNSVTALRARAGYAMDTLLVYGTGGMAWGDMDRSFTTTNGANSFTPSGDDDAQGYQLGLGVEKKLTPRWTLGVEYLHTSLDDGDYRVAVGRGTAPLTNPFLLVDPTGTDMRRTNDSFEYGSLAVTTNWRF